jgi:chitinase
MVDESFFIVLLRELGSRAHLDRLTVFKARANGMKGTVSFLLF